MALWDGVDLTLNGGTGSLILVDSGSRTYLSLGLLCFPTFKGKTYFNHNETEAKTQPSAKSPGYTMNGDNPIMICWRNRFTHVFATLLTLRV